MTLTSGLRLVRRVEDELAADRRDADAVAVAADAADDAVDEVAGPRVGRVAEPEGVEDGDRPGAHREDVAEDAADAGRRALVRLDGARVVVRLDLERDRQPVADRDDAGVLARAGDDALAGGRQRPQERLRALVRAVLAPHDAEHRELEVVRVAGRAGRGSPSSSSSVRPSRRWSGGSTVVAAGSRVIGRPRPTTGRRRRPGARSAARLDERADDPEPVVGAEDRLDRGLRVGHQAGDVAGRVRHAGDRPERAVRVCPVVLAAGDASRRRGRSGTGPGRSPRARRASPSSA